jgi:hypothetical protein
MAMISDRVVWEDDFLGDTIDEKYHCSFANGGNARITGNENLLGGWLEIYATPSAGSVARLRFGTDLDDDGKHHLQFSAAKQAKCEGLVMLNHANKGEATFGFVGKDDPDNVLGAALWRSGEWLLQTCANGQSTVVRTHTGGGNGVQRLRIETYPEAAGLWINDVLVCFSTTNIPTVGAPFEIQVWGDQGHPTTMWIDAIRIEQRR